MKKFITLLFAGLLFAGASGCAKKVDKADEPVPGLELDVPGFDDEPGADDDNKTDAN